jgi:hypothetical protein
MSETLNLADYDAGNPNPWLALSLDQSTFFDQTAKDALLRNNNSWSRRTILPIIRPLCRLSIAFIKLIRILVPSRFTSPKALHWTICLGMKHFVQPDANYLILRHFHIGTQILRFLRDNLDVETVPFPLLPEKIDDIYPNMFIQHDLNIYNFIIQANAQMKKEGRSIMPKPLQDINFSAISDFDPLINLPKRKWHNFLDLQSAIETYTPLFALLLSDKDFWRASNSLQLDETMAIYIGRLFNRDSVVGYISNKHPMVPISTFEAGFRLMIHGLDAENLYGFIKYMQAEQRKTALTEHSLAH